MYDCVLSFESFNTPPMSDLLGDDDVYYERGPDPKKVALFLGNEEDEPGDTERKEEAMALVQQRVPSLDENGERLETDEELPDEEEEEKEKVYVRCVAFSPDVPVLAVATDNAGGTASIPYLRDTWDKAFATLRSLAPVKGLVTLYRVLPLDRDPVPYRVLRGANSVISSLAWAPPPHDRLAAGTFDGSVVIWDTAKEYSENDERPWEWVYSCKQSPTPRVLSLAWKQCYLAMGLDNGTIAVYNTNHNKLDWKWDLPEAEKAHTLMEGADLTVDPAPLYVISLAWDPRPDAKTLAFTVAGDKHVFIARHGTLEHSTEPSLNEAAGPARFVAWSSSGGGLVSGDARGELTFWDPVTGLSKSSRSLAPSIFEPISVYALAWGSGLRLAVATDRKEIKIVAPRGTIQTLPLKVQPVGLSWECEGRYLAYHSKDAFYVMDPTPPQRESSAVTL